MRKKPWLIAVDMGYGHQRPAHSLRHLAYKRTVVTANNYPGIPVRDRRFWKQSNSFYNFISKIKRVPFIGRLLFNAFDHFQEIENFYPRRDLSAPSFILKQIYRLIRKGWGRHLIETLSEDPRPLICTFFTPAFWAEEYGYSGEIYLVVTDSDISRTWAPLYPQKTRITYLAPTRRVVERLKQYGIPETRILFTGFPLPPENLGNKKFGHLKKRVLMRLKNLDPEKRYLSLYDQNVERHLGKKSYPKKADHPLTLTFAVGGAGAQKEIGTDILTGVCQYVSDAMQKMCKSVIQKDINIILVAGTHENVKEHFVGVLKRLKLKRNLGKNIRILFEPTFEKYYATFNKVLDRTDILWTKPSELSFYAGLGIPIILAPPIGSQEKKNLEWVTKMGAGIAQEDVEFVAQWLDDWLREGLLAEAALEGFIEVPKDGTFIIQKILNKKRS